MKRARFSFLEIGGKGGGDQTEGKPVKTGDPAVKHVNRAIEPDDELPLDRSGTEVVCHTCRSCGAENFPQSKTCRVCEGELGGPGQREYDIEMHNKKKQAAVELADELERQKASAREKNDRIVREAEIAVREEKLASAKARLWFWGIVSLISLAAVVILYLYLTPPQFLGLLVGGIIMYVTYRIRAASRNSSHRFFRHW